MPKFKLFPDYTDEMYAGNAPSCCGHKMLDGGTADKWECKYGGGETYKGKVLYAEFNIDRTTSIFICDDALWISKILASGVWQYCINCYGMPDGVCISRKLIHDMEPEEAKRIISTKIKNCKFWDIVQERANQMFEGKR